jgi:hypothetical protein
MISDAGDWGGRGSPRAANRSARRNSGTPRLLYREPESRGRGTRIRRRQCGKKQRPPVKGYVGQAAIPPTKHTENQFFR